MQLGKSKHNQPLDSGRSFLRLSKVCWKENIVWSPGYFVLNVGIDKKSFIRYVQFRTGMLGFRLSEARMV